MTSLFSFGNKFILKGGKPIVRNDIISAYNSAAIGSKAKWNGGLNFTSVGTNGMPSYYGTFDQTGNIFEWVDSTGNLFKVVRGGDIDGWSSKSAGYDATNLTRYIKVANSGSIYPARFVDNPNFKKGKPEDQDFGGRIASSGNPLNLPGFVTIGDVGNTADTTGFGAVSYQYDIGKYTITNDEYCAFLNAVATTPTDTSAKDIVYGINNQNIIWEINLTDKTYYPVFDTQIKEGVRTNGLSFDSTNKLLYVIDQSYNLYYWDLGSNFVKLGNLETLGSLACNNQEICAAAYYNNAIWFFHPSRTTKLVKASLTYTNGIPSIGTITQYTTNISGIYNLFGDISIDSTGKIYASTVDGAVYTLNTSSPSNSFTKLKSPIYPAANPRLQNSFGRNDTTWYGHLYDTGTWHIISKVNGNLTSIGLTTSVSTTSSDQTGIGFRDLCGANNISLYNLLYSYQMGCERVGGIVRSYNASTNKFSYSVKTNYGNKPAYFLSWFNMARYCNWLHNNYGSLETGAYTLNNANSGIIQKNSGAKYWIPSENEWYKAAYYKGNGTNKGYWKYATQSNTVPLEVNASAVGDGTIKQINVKSQTNIGNNITLSKVTDVVHDAGVAFTFDNVSSTGTTSVSPLPQYGIPGLPANFYLSNTLAKYNLSTTAAHSGDITVCFTLPSDISLKDFNKVRILHKEVNKPIVDNTILTGPKAPNFNTKTICAKVTNFSDFYAIAEEPPFSGVSVTCTETPTQNFAESSGLTAVFSSGFPNPLNIVEPGWYANGENVYNAIVLSVDSGTGSITIDSGDGEFIPNEFYTFCSSIQNPDAGSYTPPTIDAPLSAPVGSAGAYNVNMSSNLNDIDSQAYAVIYTITDASGYAYSERYLISNPDIANATVDVPLAGTYGNLTVNVATPVGISSPTTDVSTTIGVTDTAPSPYVYSQNINTVSESIEIIWE